MPPLPPNDCGYIWTGQTAHGWEEAYDVCNDLGTHLPHIFSQEDNDRLLTFRNDNVGEFTIPLGGGSQPSNAPHAPSLMS